MNRRDFLAHSTTMALATWASPALTQDAAGTRPNILFCLADDWGWPHAGAYGDKVVQTPTFDRLAREGVLFENAFVAVPSCTPCRNSILTGQMFYRLGEGANLWSTLDPKIPTFVGLLAAAGYATGHWRKAWGPGDFRALGYKENPCGPRAKNFPQFMADRPKDKPFCFWLGTSDPHRPYKKGTGRASGMDLAKIRVPGFFPDTEEVRSDIADYYVEVQRWDRDVGKAVDILEKQGQLDNTIIVMTGDHGMPFPRCKGNLYDWGVRVPLAIRWGKGIKRPGRRVTDFTSLPDLAPTFLAVTGTEAPNTMTARSLAYALRSDKAGRVDAARDLVVTGRERHCQAQTAPSTAGYPVRAIRTDRWLYIMNLEPGRWPAGVPENGTQGRGYADCDGGPTKTEILAKPGSEATKQAHGLCFARRPADELYDAQADPYQLHNLAAQDEHGAVLASLRKRLVAYLEETADPRFTDAPVRFDTYSYRGRRAKKRGKKNQ
ncbi:MAG: sulfatase [Victivallales bacterium]|nr:sulfatase [Victivallales bacterium]